MKPVDARRACRRRGNQLALIANQSHVPCSSLDAYYACRDEALFAQQMHAITSRLNRPGAEYTPALPYDQSVALVTAARAATDAAALRPHNWRHFCKTHGLRGAEDRGRDREA